MTIPAHVQRVAAQIAKDPAKVAAFSLVKSNATKTASWTKDLFGGAQKSRTGTQELLRAIAATSGAALLGVAGTSAYRGTQQLFGAKTPLTKEEEDKELGRLNARSSFAASRAAALSKEHDAVLQSLIKTDSLIKDAPKPLVSSSFKTMTKFAPNLAADENAARSFLRTAIESGSGPSFATLQTLADAERSVQQAGGISFGGK